MNPRPAPSAETSFHGLGLAPFLLEILGKLQFVTPTPIQHRAIPIGIEGKDLIGVAQTGTGKTLAFGLPMIQRLHQASAGASDRTMPQGLILLPTRELALQVDDVLRKIGHDLHLRTAVLIGGMTMGPQIAAIRRNPNIIIATPGRLNDHLQQKIITLNRVSTLVLDEADHMLDMGFLPQIKKILDVLPKEKQTMLFSATLSSDIMKIATANMKLPLRIEVAPQGTTVEKIVQEVFIVRKEDKIRLLEKILSEERGSALVFMGMKFAARKVVRALQAMGHTAAEIHSNRSLNQRKEALEGFKSGKYKVLVATDIAARGIDVKGIELVINYDLPSHSPDYVHRIGRTGRAGAEGRAVSFVLPQEKYDLRSIERLIQKNLTVSKLPELPPARNLPREEARDNRPQSRHYHTSSRSHQRGRPRSYR